MTTIDDVKNDAVVRCLEAEAFQLRQSGQVDVLRLGLAEMTIDEMKRKHAQELDYVLGVVDTKNDWIVELARENSALKAIIAELNKELAEKDETLARIGAEYEAKYKSMIDAQV